MSTPEPIAGRNESGMAGQSDADRTALPVDEGVPEDVTKEVTKGVAEGAVPDSRDILARVLLEQIADSAVVLTDTELNIVACSVGAEQAFGFGRVEMVGQSMGMLYGADDCELGVPRSEADRALREGNAERECWCLRKDGTRFWAHYNITPIRSDPGGVLGFYLVVSHWSGGSGNTLLVSVSRAPLELAINLAALGTWEYKASEGVLWADARMFRLFDLPVPEGEWRDTSVERWLARIHPADRERITTLTRHVLGGGMNEFSIEYRILLEEGRLRWITARGTVVYQDATGKPDRIVGVAADITEYKQREQRAYTDRARYARIAHALRRSLLLAPPPDAYPGLRFRSFYRPASKEMLIGGDFYDVFAVQNDVVGLMVGDVTGKGLSAATYTAEVRFALRAFLREHSTPTAALRLLNDFLVQDQRLEVTTPHLSPSYVALSLALVNTSTGEVAISSAGAEPPLLLHPPTCGVREISTGGMLLGVAEHEEYDQEVVRLEVGDLLILTTDGLTEARRTTAQGVRFFGTEGIATAACEAIRQGKSLTQVGEHIITCARDWAGNEQLDDICLLLASYSPPEVLAL